MAQSPCNSPASIDCVRLHLKEFLNEPRRLQEWLGARAPSKYEPFYCSIDLRDAGFKLAPVDANLYPAGFNNVCPEDLEKAPDAILKPLLLRHLGKVPKRIAILPEFHTRNKFYVDNLYELRQLFRRLGIETEVGWIPESPEAAKTPIPLQTTDDRTVVAYPFTRTDNKLVFEPYEPEFILLNNDFSSGFPDILKGLTQPIEPSPKLGWHTRKKSDFFHHYNKLAGELAQAAGIEPWQLQVTTRLVDQVNFDTSEGLDRIANAVDEILDQMREQYAKHKIDEPPYVFVKNNAGTYGMGIYRAESGKELLELNRRERNKMAVGKNNLQVHDVIVQEGIPTRFQIDKVYAEPVIYLMGGDLMGGFLRKNATRGKTDNLNSKGMVFQKLCISDLREGVDRDLELEMVYGTIARLSAAAVTLEIAKAESTETSSMGLANFVEAR
jgi:glutamate--cysteine ligase